MRRDLPVGNNIQLVDFNRGSGVYQSVGVVYLPMNII